MSPEALAAGITTAVSDGGVCLLLTMRYVPSSPAVLRSPCTSATCCEFAIHYIFVISSLTLRLVIYIYSFFSSCDIFYL